MLELFLVTLQITYTAIIDRKKQLSIFSFLNLYSGFLANSVDPDQPAFSEAGYSGSTLFAIQCILCCIIWFIRATCFHMLKIASDGNFYLLFGENY